MRIDYVDYKTLDITDSASSIFLAGPSPREKHHYNWRSEALEILEDSGFDGVVFVPLTSDWGWLGDFDAQTDWELDSLERASVVMFWVPRDLENLPGFTTNVEYGLFARSGKVVLGFPQDAPKMKYLAKVAQRFSIPIFHSLDLTIKHSLSII